MIMTVCLLTLESYSLSLIRQDGSLPILSDLSFCVDRGEIVGLVGPSGSGKSMIFSAISRLLQQLQPVDETGEIKLSIDGQSYVLNKMDDLRTIWKKHIGIIFQQSAEMLNPRQTIFTQLSEKMETPNLSDIHTLLTSVGLVPAEKFAKAYPFNLSGGQLQRVLIALALVNRPPLILADEPFSAVDAELKEDLSQLLVSLVTKHNMGLLLVSHDQQLIKRLSDRVLFLDNGQLVGASTAVSQDTVPTKALTTQNQILLEVGQLKKSYAEGGLFSSSKLSQNIIDDFSLHLHQGEILGIQGPSGVGKSTLARLLAGMETFESGHIRYKGQDINTLSKIDRDQYCKMVQLIPQDPMSRMPPHRSVKAHFEDVFFVRKQAYNPKQVNEVMMAVQLDERLLIRLPRQLSGGQRQRVLIAKALLMDVELLICDEIFSALDQIVQSEIGTVLQSLVARKSLSIIMISHDTRILRSYCHRVLKM